MTGTRATLLAATAAGGLLFSPAWADSPGEATQHDMRVDFDQTSVVRLDRAVAATPSRIRWGGVEPAERWRWSTALAARRTERVFCPFVPLSQCVGRGTVGHTVPVRSVRARRSLPPHLWGGIAPRRALARHFVALGRGCADSAKRRAFIDASVPPPLIPPRKGEGECC